MGYELKKSIIYFVITLLLFALSAMWYVSKKNSDEYQIQEELYRLSCELDINSEVLNSHFGYNFETNSADREREKLNDIVRMPTMCLFISMASLVYTGIVTHKAYLCELLEKKRRYVKDALEYELQFYNNEAKRLSSIANTLQASKNIVGLLALCGNQTGRVLMEGYRAYQEANQADLFIRIKKRIPSFELSHFPDEISGLPGYYCRLQQRALCTADELKKCAHMTDEEIDSRYHQHASTIGYLRKKNSARRRSRKGFERKKSQ